MDACCCRSRRPAPPSPRTGRLGLALGLAWTLMLASGCRQAGPASTAASAPGRQEAEGPHLYLDHPQPRLPTLKLYLGPAELEAEIARAPREIATGMMHRTTMPEGTGMLFVFARPEPRSFYMRNTLIPLSIAYLSPEGEILEIHKMQPLDETPVDSASDRVQYALEVPQGWFEKNGIRPGMIVSTARGPLPEIDWRRLQPRR